MIWCVEDDASIRDIEVYALQSTGLEARGFEDGSAFWAALQTEKPELVLLDVMLPGEDGVTLLKRMKNVPALRDIPVIMATAKGAEYDKIQSLDLGADDYITKPFSLAVLRARVNTQLRRKAIQETVVCLGKYRFDFQCMEFYAEGRPVGLSKTEQKLLRIFIENRGITLSRGSLVDRVWTDGAEYVDENALSVTVKRLRDKLGAKDDIKTVYGKGYMWVKEDE